MPTRTAGRGSWRIQLVLLVALGSPVGAGAAPGIDPATRELARRLVADVLERPASEASLALRAERVRRLARSLLARAGDRVLVPEPGSPNLAQIAEEGPFAGLPENLPPVPVPRLDGLRGPLPPPLRLGARSIPVAVAARQGPFPERAGWVDLLSAAIGEAVAGTERSGPLLAVRLDDRIYLRAVEGARAGAAERNTSFAVAARGRLVLAGLLASGRLREPDLAEFEPRVRDELLRPPGPRDAQALRDFLDRLAGALDPARRRAVPGEDPATASTSVATAPGAGETSPGEGISDPPFRPDPSLLLALLAGLLAAPLVARVRAGRAGEVAGTPAGAGSETDTHPGVGPGLAALPELPDRFERVSLLAQGAMGRVYRAEDRVLGRPVAIKVVELGAGLPGSLAERFRREAEALARLDHPGIVRIHDLLDRRPPALVMELVEGVRLDRWREAHASPPVAEVVRMGIEIASALAHAHSRGVLHRDLKPANVLVGEDGRIRLVDFGLARLEDAASSMTRPGEVLGTPLFMAPEQLEGRPVDARSDLWSTGAMLHYLVTGQPPFAPEALHARLVRAPDPVGRVRPDVPAELEAVLARCMAVAPSERFPDASRLEAALASVLAGLDPERARIAWTNALVAANRELFHGLKGRLAVVSRYPDDPARIVRLLADPIDRAERVDLARRSAAWARGAKGAPEPLAAALADACEVLEVLVGVLEGEDEVRLVPALQRGFDACKRIADLAAEASERHVLELSGVALGFAGRGIASGILVACGRDGDPVVEVVADRPDDLGRELAKVLEVLVVNAAEAGARQVELVTRNRSEADEAVLEVRDDGPGLPPGDPELLFRPGNSRKPGGSGTGLGEARSRLAPFGGRIEALPGAGPGACFRIVLPRRSREFPAGVAHPGPPGQSDPS